jgi:hypothetical protein
MSIEALAEDLARFTNDPYGFALWAFPWGEPGTELERFPGLESWQVRILTDIRDGLLTPSQAIAQVVAHDEAPGYAPQDLSRLNLTSSTAAICIATASGHGVGKSALVAIIILWAISTMEDTRGVITANTEAQLKTKTWAELGKWHRLFIARDLFKLTATAIFSPDRERTWRIDMIPWSENNPEAFAGLHNQGKRVLLIMDEASTIADIIHETAEGALTDADTQIIWLMFGNPTRNSGRFREAFPGGKFAKYWRHYQVDSRTVSFTNKAQFAQWTEAYGEDSDFVRIRIRGVFPRQGEMEFFSAEEIDEAMARVPSIGVLDPIALGVDVARFGVNNSVIYARRGRDAKTIPRKVFNGLSTVELADRVYETWAELRADGIFIDGGGVGGGVVDNVRAKTCFATTSSSAPSPPRSAT